MVFDALWEGQAHLLLSFIPPNPGGGRVVRTIRYGIRGTMSHPAILVFSIAGSGPIPASFMTTRLGTLFMDVAGDWFFGTESQSAIKPRVRGLHLGVCRYRRFGMFGACK